MKTGRELKLSSALVYLCCFNYWHFPWREQQTWTISLLGLHVQLSYPTIWLSTVGECFVKNTQHVLFLWEQKYSSYGLKVALKSDLTNSSFTQKHTLSWRELYKYLLNLFSRELLPKRNWRLRRQRQLLSRSKSALPEENQWSNSDFKPKKN